jgi:hypothetical protein
MNPLIFNWYMRNIRALQRLYGSVSSEQSHFRWVLIQEFVLPPCFNHPTSALLFETPSENLTLPDGFSFYLNQHLRRTDGKPTNRLHDNDSYNPYSREGYSRLSFHIYVFKPNLADPANGNNLIGICERLYSFLGDVDGIR